MSSIASYSRAALALVAVVAVTACSKPPQEAIAAGDEAQAAAQAAGAAEYAPEAWIAVTQAKAALDAELAAQGEKMSLTRSYKLAEELAGAYQAAAQQATTAAAAAMEQARNEATTLITESRLALDEATAMLASAPRGKGAAADLAAMKADLEAAGMTLTEAESALSAGTYLDARAKATSAREVIEQVKTAVATAQAARR